MKLRTVALCLFLLTLPAWPIAPVAKLPPVVAQAVVKADESPKPTPVPTVADVQRADAEAVAAIVKANAVRAAFDKEIAKLKLPSIGAFGVGIGKPGKDGHSPVLTWVGDQLAIDGKVTGPHLTGPQGTKGDKGEPGGTPTPPIPVPVATKLYVLFIEETSEAAASRGAMFADLDLAKRVKERGHHWRVVDKDVRDAAGAVPADVKPWLDRVKDSKYPWLFLVTPDGTVAYDGIAPTTAKAFVDLLASKGG